MGFDLEGAHGCFHFNNTGWKMALTIANENGWQPRGTEPPVAPPGTMGNPYEDWDGGYGFNDGQTVTAEDASAIAEALDIAIAKGLPPIPKDDPNDEEAQEIRETLRK